MAIFKKDTIVATYPAYDIVTREPNGLGITQITSGETLIASDRLATYSVGSVVSYALEYNECPIHAHRTAVERGHQTHWLNARASIITQSDTSKETHLQVDFDATYNLEGVLVKIVATSNLNLEFEFI